ncbi:MAG: NADH-quinone oxidoreductase subunit C [Elusimicrobia bacterium]|nr:NADH-quinone oxidoreductase subunit C [Elusimicrobiota bacterium]
MKDIIGRIQSKLGDRGKDIKEQTNNRVYVSVDRKNIKECAKILFEDMDARYIVASGMENFDSFEILYHFGFDKESAIVSLRVYLDKDNPEIDTLTDIIPGISYIEREMWELLGINFKGHPNMKHFLLGDDWEKGNYPLRKDKYEK